MGKCHWCATNLTQRGKKYCTQAEKDKALHFIYWPNNPPEELVARNDVECQKGTE